MGGDQVHVDGILEGDLHIYWIEALGIVGVYIYRHRHIGTLAIDLSI